MILTARNSSSILSLILASLSLSSCSAKSTTSTPTVVMGHRIGESSMGWSVAENSDGDPLSKCQEMIRSPLLDGFQHLAQKCQDFVDNGSYLIITQDARTRRERAYQFKKWKLALFVIQLRYEDEDNLIAKLNSQFNVVERAKRWLGKDGTSIEIRPNEDFSFFPGNAPKLEGVLVVVSSPDAF